MTADEQVQLRNADEHARRVAQTCFDRPLVLEAGAGTGKTATLVARIVAWSIGPGWERAAASTVPDDRVASEVLKRVAAITFTEAAAAEMAERVGRALCDLETDALPIGLSEAALPASVGLRRERCRALISALDHLVVSTIHAWCRRILMRHPLAAGFHPGFEVDADESVQQRVVREVIEATLRDTYSDSTSAPLLELAVAGVGPLQVEDALTTLIREGVEPDDLSQDPASPERLQAACDALADALTSALALAGGLAGVERSKRTTETVAALARSGDLMTTASGQGFDACADGLREVWDEASLKRLRDWSAGRFLVGETNALGNDAPKFRDAVEVLLGWLLPLLQHDPRTLECARGALVPLLATARSELRRRGAASYASLLRGARDLLRDRPAVRKSLRAELDLLLVDEFQDTDPLQCEIVRLIALDGPPDERPALFLVGDPKQSIYGWRNADLRAYDDFITEVVRQGGERHRLSVNFRSAPAILAEVERVIGPVMEEVRGVQPPFEALVPSKETSDSPGFCSAVHAPVEYWVSWEWDGSAGACVEGNAVATAALEARALARDLASLHFERGVPWSDAAVLFRSLGDLEIYLQELRAAGVPYTVERDQSYYRRREVIEAAAAVRCVLDPNDGLALLTFLRSSYVGVPDAALIPLWTRSIPERVSALQSADPDQLAALAVLVREVRDAPPPGVPDLQRVEGWDASLLAALESLGELRRSFELDASDRFVEKLRTLLLQEVTEAARFLGPYRAANLDRFFRELAQELSGGGDPQALLRRLRVAVAEGQDAEEERPKDATHDAVRVMTVHKAKGLDFEHVYLVQLHRGFRPPPTPAVEIDRTGDHLEYRLFGAPTPGFGRVTRARAAVEAAERVRTLYVAMTRAKQRLVLLGRWAAKGRSGQRAPATGVSAAHSARATIDLLAAREPQPRDLAATMAELAVRPGECWRDDAAARWVFPALSSETAAAKRDWKGPALAAPASWADPAACAVASERLREQRFEAELRMRRPLVSSATDEPVDDPEAAGFPLALAGGRPDEALSPAKRDLAAAVGSAIHVLLERFDLEADPREEAAHQRACLVDLLAGRVDPDQLTAATRDAEAIWEQFTAGPLFRRFADLRARIVARELPVLAPPDDVGALGFTTGVIDLVYRDDATGELVVADYKTGGDADTARFAAQGGIYVRALGEALELERPPRFELWLLRQDEIVPIEAGHAHGEEGAPDGSAVE